MKRAVVNARVPLAKKERAQGVLNEIGSNTTDLINSAYDYLLVKGSLPIASSRAASTKKSFNEFVSRSTLEVDWGDDVEKSYKELLVEEKQTDYESLD